MPLPEIIDKPAVRVTIGIFIGLPMTLFAFLYGPIGVITGIAGIITTREPLFFFGMTVATIAGMLGVCGAWIRLRYPHVHLTSILRRICIWFLACGVLSAGLLAVNSVLDGKAVVVLPAGLLMILGAIFILATPITPSNSQSDTDTQARRST